MLVMCGMRKRKESIPDLRTVVLYSVWASAWRVEFFNVCDLQGWGLVGTACASIEKARTRVFQWASETACRLIQGPAST